MRFALRSLAKSPGYTAIALLTLALGIGVNTSMFSVVDALLIRAGPFPDPERLVQLIAVTRQGESQSFSEPELRELRAHTSAYASFTVMGGGAFSVAEPGRPAERLLGFSVAENFFETFGVQPQLGRAFTPEEHLPGRNHVAILSHTFWQQRFGGSADVLGRTLRLDGETVTIVGVMPARFDYRMLWGNAALWRPLNFTKDQVEYRDYRAFNFIARLRPGATLAQAAAELGPLATQQEKEHPQSYSGLRYRLAPLHEALMDDLSRKISWMLIGLSSFVLLIACANLANLQLARATAGVRDLAIRAALGASRRQLIVQQLTESLLLSLTGGALGLLVASGVNQLLDRHILIGGVPGGLDVHIARPVLLLTLVLSLLTGLLFGLVPAWIASRTDVNAALRTSSRGSTSSRSHHRLRQILIVGEVALALVLLGGAGVMHRGFARFLERAAGWDTHRVLTATLAIPETRFDTSEKRVDFFRKLELRLTALPGIESAALSTSLPLFSYTGDRPLLVEGQSAADAARLPAGFHVMVTADYFATMGIPLLEGRLLPRDLKPADPRVVVINEAAARQLWPGKSAIGQRLGSIDSGETYWAEVIGVVRDVESAASLTHARSTLQIYKPLVHEPWSFVYLAVRSPVPAGLADTVRRAVAEVDPDLPIDQIGTVRQIVDQQQHNLVVVAQLLTGFALLGLILAALGLYGVIANLVAQRTGEFGIRLALGATPNNVLTLVLRHGLQLAALGLCLGFAGAYGLARFLSAIMPRLASPDPLALLGVSLILFVVALLACWLPARRATKVDPMIALRAE